MCVVYFTLQCIQCNISYSYPFIDEDRHGTTREKHEGDGNFRQVFFGRLVRSSKQSQQLLISSDLFLGHVKLFEGSARHLIKKFNVKTRAYYGNTSMDSEMSLLMANQTLVS